VLLARSAREPLVVVELLAEHCKLAFKSLDLGFVDSRVDSRVR
jgi:hypothetical protein